VPSNEPVPNEAEVVPTVLGDPVYKNWAVDAQSKGAGIEDVEDDDA
jgi:hypothetical protein